MTAKDINKILALYKETLLADWNMLEVSLQSDVSMLDLTTAMRRLEDTHRAHDAAREQAKERIAAKARRK